MGGETDWLTKIGNSLMGVSVLGLLGLLPVIFGLLASLMACICYGLQIYNNKTVRDFFQSRRDHKIAVLQTKIDALRSKNPGP